MAAWGCVCSGARTEETAGPREQKPRARRARGFCELYPEVVDGIEKEGGAPSRLIEDRPLEGGKGRHAMTNCMQSVGSSSTAPFGCRPEGNGREGGCGPRSSMCPARARATLLGSQDSERIGCAARAGAPAGQATAARSGARRDAPGRQPRDRRVRAEVAEGRREGRQGPPRAAGVLRLPRRALATPADHESESKSYSTERRSRTAPRSPTTTPRRTKGSPPDDPSPSHPQHLTIARARPESLCCGRRAHRIGRWC
jgi:hypothetical protein